MNQHRGPLHRVIAVGLIVVAQASYGQRPPAILVGANVVVSRAHSADTHYEVLASAHPRDSARLIVGSLIYSSDGMSSGSVVYTSNDGGATWAPTLDGKALEHTGDPATAYGPDGTAYYAVSLIPSATAPRTMLVFRSGDGGTRWEGPFTATYMDRHYLTVDASNGRVYLTGNNRVPRTVADFVVFSSTDGGRSFRGPGKREAFGRTAVPAMGNAVVLSSGTLVGVFAETDTLTRRDIMRATASTDGGATLTPATTIGTYVAGGERKGVNLGNASAQPMLAVDAWSSGFRDRLYVVWPDRSSGHSRILFASSSDAGKTWTQPRAVDDNAATTTTDHFMTNVAVNRDGVVGIMWYDRRDHPDNLGWDVRFTASLDGGATFLPSVKVSEQGTTFPVGSSLVRQRPNATARDSAALQRATIAAARESFTYMGGDTAGLAADASGGFHPVWVDNRSGVPQVWTARVQVRR